MFSIIITLDELEKAFLKDAIPEAEYTEICERSLKQYRSILADETVSRAFVSLEQFKAEWGVRGDPDYAPFFETCSFSVNGVSLSRLRHRGPQSE